MAINETKKRLERNRVDITIPAKPQMMSITEYGKKILPIFTHISQDTTIRRTREIFCNFSIFLRLQNYATNRQTTLSKYKILSLEYDINEGICRIEEQLYIF